jgi:ribonuclease G
MRSGAYLIIEHTEAMHVIDVNSGHRAKSDETQETNALDVNMEAASEVARQLRLRDMGGIIVIDFIDMKSLDNKKLIYKVVKEEMMDDKAKSTILPLSKFGLMQITRERVRPQMNIVTREVCPTCNGTGKITASILVSDLIEKNIEHLLVKQNEKNLVLAVHPYLHAFYTKGFISQRMRWYFKYKSWISLVKDTSMAIIEYKFLNKEGEEIQLTS